MERLKRPLLVVLLTILILNMNILFLPTPFVSPVSASPEPVTDPDKMVTDSVLVGELKRQGVDKDYVELYRDYASRSEGGSPYAQIYRDLKSEKKFMVVSGLPMVNAKGEKVVVGWDRIGKSFLSKTNVFATEVNGSAVTLTAINDQPWGAKAGDNITWNPQLFINGTEQYPRAQGDATLLPADPENENYRFNVLEWDYGVCKRRIRLIEGILSERWIFNENPNGEVRIKHNCLGDLPLSLGIASDSFDPLNVTVNNDEEVVSADELAEAKYPVWIGASQTFYPDPDPESTSVDGYVYHLDTNGLAWSTLRNAAGTGSYDSLTFAHCTYIMSDDTSNLWTRLSRAIFLFDTSALPDDAQITLATLSVYGNIKIDDLGCTPNLCVYSSNPASNTALVLGDYTKLGTTTYSNVIAYADLVINAYNNFNLNSNGIAAISKTGVSKFGIRNKNYDADNVSPTWKNYLESRFHCYSSEQGTGYKPKLVVTYGPEIVERTVNQRLNLSYEAMRAPFTRERSLEQTLQLDTEVKASITSTFYVSHGYDDAFERESGGFYLSADDVTVESHYASSERYYGGFRFQNVNIPKGSTITSATIKAYVWTSNDDIRTYIYGNDVDNAENFYDNQHIVSTSYRPRTSAFIAWVQDNMGTGWKEKSGLENIVAEITSRDGWSSGNALVLLFVPYTDIIKCTDFASYENNPSYNARLEITYIPPIPPTTRIVEQSLAFLLKATRLGSFSKVIERSLSCIIDVVRTAELPRIVEQQNPAETEVTPMRILTRISGALVQFLTELTRRLFLSRMTPQAVGILTKTSRTLSLSRILQSSLALISESLRLASLQRGVGHVFNLVAQALRSLFATRVLDKIIQLTSETSRQATITRASPLSLILSVIAQRNLFLSREFGQDVTLITEVLRASILSRIAPQSLSFILEALRAFTALRVVEHICEIAVEVSRTSILARLIPQPFILEAMATIQLAFTRKLEQTLSMITEVTSFVGIHAIVQGSLSILIDVTRVLSLKRTFNQPLNILIAVIRTGAFSRFINQVILLITGAIGEIPVIERVASAVLSFIAQVFRQASFHRIVDIMLAVKVYVASSLFPVVPPVPPPPTVPKGIIPYINIFVHVIDLFAMDAPEVQVRIKTLEGVLITELITDSTGITSQYKLQAGTYIIDLFYRGVFQLSQTVKVEKDGVILMQMGIPVVITFQMILLAIAVIVFLVFLFKFSRRKPMRG